MANKDIIFINSHPIQYFAPMYQYMNEQGLNTQAWYCSYESIKGSFDKQFGTQVKWDIPLLEGYKYHFFKNYSPKPSHFNGFFGLMNFGMIRQLFNVPKSVIVVHGWHYFTLLLILLLGKIRGHTMCLRCELPQNQERLKTGFKQKLKKIGLQYVLFPRIDYFLYIGNQNKAFYKTHRIKESRLLFCPYSVDNARFNNEYKILQSKANLIKQELSMPADSKVILYAGKYIDKKRPMDVLQAFTELNDLTCWLVMVGEGELRRQMEEYIEQKKVSNVILTGFINQSKIGEYYTIATVFTMCSTVGETWGLSVNEAMNFNLPLVVSDLTGCADDLVVNGVNGYIYTTGSVSELKEALQKVLNHKLSWKESSEQRVNAYSYRTVMNSLQTLA